MIPPIENPSILDIGCGTGIQSIELAKMSDGHITAIDIDISALTLLQRNIKEQGLSDRFAIKQVSMDKLNLLGDNFDIIWAEGSIYAIGFERGIRDWKEYLRKDGYLVIHDEDDRVEIKLGIIKKYGFKVLGQIDVTHGEWEERYYKPLLEIMSKRKLADSEAMSLRKEIDTFKRTKMGSVFFILQN
jgi:cyclopropane fatty-acyl-phospholipid synthase-like methyltransferase